MPRAVQVVVPGQVVPVIAVGHQSPGIVIEVAGVVPSRRPSVVRRAICTDAYPVTAIGIPTIPTTASDIDAFR